ncbi:hypothetical protein ACFVZH_11930 [Streptomyces sp. NPDC059534]|uniref:hypothetical protein n=1 Tax=Streptomyces sp. NPDC059534 TaxID=3346859 RepID=UPI0036C22E3A
MACICRTLPLRSPAPEAYAYRWKADGVDIAGATGASYTLPSELFGKQLSVAVTARRTGHPVVTATSAAVVVSSGSPRGGGPSVVPGASNLTSRQFQWVV